MSGINGIGNYSSLLGARQVSSVQFRARGRFQDTLMETRPSGDRVSISEEARKRLEEEAIKLGAGKGGSASSALNGNGQASESSSPQNGRQEMMDKIQEQIERLEQRLEVVATSNMSDQQKEAVTGQIQEQISQLRMQLEALAAEQNGRQVGMLSL